MFSCLTPYRLRACLVTISATLCLGCQGLFKRDAVTGRGTINQYSEADEIRLGDGVLQSFQSQCRQQQIPFDAPGDHLELVQNTGSRLVDVSHRQNLPWEFHFVSSSDVNACAAPGGKVFVFAGLFGNLVSTPEELAAVLAHEVAHVTARHTAERMSRERFAPIVSKSAGSKFYKASFGTRQEDEADRIGLLYMALAGFDPAVAPRIWHRAHEKYGSEPGNYLFDHSLHADRARKVESLVSTARKYFKGPGVINSDWKSILANNDLIERSSTSDDSGAAIEALADAFIEHKETRNEVKSREAAARKQAISKYVRISNLKFERTSDGKAGVFVDVTNGSNVHIRSVTLTIHYLNKAGISLFNESIRTNAIPSGRTIRPGFYQKAVKGSDRVNVVTTDLDPD